MKFIKPVDGGQITSKFNVQRGNHIHGAIDYGVLTNKNNILAPEKGEYFFYVAHRSKPGIYWNKCPMVHGKFFPWRNYFDDWAGVIIVLTSHDKQRTHVMLHPHIDKTFTTKNITGFYSEIDPVYNKKTQSKDDKNCMWTKKKKVNAGDIICPVGNAGKSTDFHLHWEIHSGYNYQRHASRINPEDFLL